MVSAPAPPDPTDRTGRPGPLPPRTRRHLGSPAATSGAPPPGPAAAPGPAATAQGTARPGGPNGRRTLPPAAPRPARGWTSPGPLAPGLCPGSAAGASHDARSASPWRLPSLQPPAAASESRPDVRPGTGRPPHARSAPSLADARRLRPPARLAAARRGPFRHPGARVTGECGARVPGLRGAIARTRTGGGCAQTVVRRGRAARGWLGEAGILQPGPGSR